MDDYDDDDEDNDNLEYKHTYRVYIPYWWTCKHM